MATIVDRSIGFPGLLGHDKVVNAIGFFAMTFVGTALKEHFPRSIALGQIGSNPKRLIPKATTSPQVTKTKRRKGDHIPNTWIVNYLKSFLLGIKVECLIAFFRDKVAITVSSLEL
jgi:hypothetical protein